MHPEGMVQLASHILDEDYEKQIFRAKMHLAELLTHTLDERQTQALERNRVIIEKTMNDEHYQKIYRSKWW